MTVYDTYDEFKQLTKFSLHRNSLMVIRDFSFSALKELTHLTLSQNLITTVQRFAFYGLTSLQSLNLKRNRIQQISLGDLPLGTVVNLQVNTALRIKSLYGLKTASPNIYHYKTIGSHLCTSKRKGNVFMVFVLFWRPFVQFTNVFSSGPGSTS